MRATIIAFEGCVPSSVYGIHDVLCVANLLAARDAPPDAAPPFAPRIATTGAGPVRGFDGLHIHGTRGLGTRGLGTRGLGTPTGRELVFVPAALVETDEIVRAQGALVRWLRRAHAAGAVLCATCAGTFLLAETGALDGRPATTHWHLAADFRRRYPGVALDENRMLVDNGDCVCAGGVTAYLDLALHAVARFASPALAAACSGLLLIDTGRETQAPYRMHMPPVDHADGPVRAAQRWLREHHAETVRLRDLAEAAGLGVRTLLRRFRNATGQTPIRYLQDVRLERAKLLLQSTSMPIDHILRRTGYEDAASFRRLFKARTGLTPRGYRRRFAMCDAVR